VPEQQSQRYGPEDNLGAHSKAQRFRGRSRNERSPFFYVSPDLPFSGSKRKKESVQAGPNKANIQRLELFLYARMIERKAAALRDRTHTTLKNNEQSTRTR